MRFAPAIAVLVVFAAGAAFVFAAIPGSDGTIKACVGKNKGVLRVIDESKQFCKKGKAPLVWNQQGPEGPQGTRGPAGNPGAEGPPGPVGPTGAAGPTAGTSAFNNNASTVIAAGQVVVDLESVNDQGDRQITTTFDSRLMASANVNVERTADGTEDTVVNCVLLISDGTGPNNGLSAMGNSAGVNGTVPLQGAGPAPRVTIPLTGAATKPPGTYNVRADCATISGGAGSEVQATQANLVVWAIAD